MNELIAYRSCPLCGGDQTEHYFTGNCSKHPRYLPILTPQIKWKRCADCEHIFRDSYYTEESCGLIFNGVNENQKLGYQIEQQRKISAKIVDKIQCWKASGIWLDVGFGNGSLLFTAQEYGFTPVGLDLRRQNAEAMKSFGIEAHCTDIQDLKSESGFSVISMADVLEHMPFPKVGLASARRLLEKDGVLFLSMPNIDCAIWKMLDLNQANPYWGEIEHYHNFGRTRLYSLLEEFGFTPVHYGVSERYRACMEIISIKKDLG